MRNILYFNCPMGAAGDMLVAALFELLTEQQQAECKTVLKNSGFPDMQFDFRTESRNGLAGLRFCPVYAGRHEHPAPMLGQGLGQNPEHIPEAEPEPTPEHGHEHPHIHVAEQQAVTLATIEERLASLSLPASVKEYTRKVYLRLAAAESQAHGKPVDLIHFHELGAWDALVDILTFFYLWELLGSPAVYASALNVGSGTVRTAHGLMPVPVPAVVFLAEGAPLYGSELAYELLTPTAMAILAELVQTYCPLPQLRLIKYGRGLGGRDIPGHWNGVQVLWGELLQDSQADTLLAANCPPGAALEQIVRLSCNLDDMTGEDIAFVQELLLAQGALDVYIYPCLGKKGRPAYELVCLGATKSLATLSTVILQQSTSLGLRVELCARYVLAREILMQEHSDLGSYRLKRATTPGFAKEKLEFEQLKELALKHKLSLAALRQVLQQES